MSVSDIKKTLKIVALSDFLGILLKKDPPLKPKSKLKKKKEGKGTRNPWDGGEE